MAIHVVILHNPEEYTHFTDAETDTSGVGWRPGPAEVRIPWEQITDMRQVYTAGAVYVESATRFRVPDWASVIIEEVTL